MQKTDFETLIARSDIVTLHLPLMASTHNIISAEVIDAMKAGSILINAARGGLVDEGALDAALRRGHLQSAGLDVFEGEPPSADNLLLSTLPVFLLPILRLAPVMRWNRNWQPCLPIFPTFSEGNLWKMRWIYIAIRISQAVLSVYFSPGQNVTPVFTFFLLQLRTIIIIK